MAQISTVSNSSVYQIKRWLGLNESPDGDTILKMGESPVMRNFKITKEGHLQIRPGYSSVCQLSAGNHVRGLWSGYVGGKMYFLAACGGHIWSVNTNSWEAKSVGELDDAPTHFFGFSQKVYVMNGTEYYSWDGQGSIAPVEGYVPIVSTAAPPEGGGANLERVNLLNGKRRMQFSPDGVATVFHLPEKEVDEVISVEGGGEWTADLKAGTVTFDAAPEEAVNSVTITWKKGNGNRKKVCSMRFSETYNGSADTRVFLYGDGTNDCIYSDLDENGIASAEYFPDMNFISVDSANTPINSMVRHYDRLMVFKADGAFCIQYSTLTLETGAVTSAFTCIPVNRNIGSSVCGRSQLVKNNPRTLHGQGVYEWALSGAGSRDERNAKRVSDRVGTTLAEFSLEDCVTFDDEEAQEFYVVCGNEAVVNNYSNDTWYYYTNFPATCFVSVEGSVYFGTPDGHIMFLSRIWHSDNGNPIDAYWESGAMDFGADLRRKYSSHIWVSMKPESQSNIAITVQSDKKSDYAYKEISSTFSTFANASFPRWTFNTSKRPRVARVKLKVKKFTYYKLIFSSLSNLTTATILGSDFEVRYTGNVK